MGRRLCALALALAGVGQALSLPAVSDMRNRQARQSETRSKGTDDWYGGAAAADTGTGTGTGTVGSQSSGAAQYTQETAMAFVEVAVNSSFDIGGFKAAVEAQLQTMTDLFYEVEVPAAWVVDGQDSGANGMGATVVASVWYEGNGTAVAEALRTGIAVTYDDITHTGFAFKTAEVLFEADYDAIDPALFTAQVNVSLAAAGADVGAVLNISVAQGSVIVTLDFVASTYDPDGTGAADIDDIIDDPDGLVVSYDGTEYVGVRYHPTTSTASTTRATTTRATTTRGTTTPPNRPAPDVAFTGEGIPLTTTKLLVAAGAAGTVAFFLFIVLAVAQVRLHWSGKRRTRTIAMVSSAPDVGGGGGGGGGSSGSLLPARANQTRYGTMANPRYGTMSNQMFQSPDGLGGKAFVSPTTPTEKEKGRSGDWQAGTEVHLDTAVPGSDTKSTASWQSDAGGLGSPDMEYTAGRMAGAGSEMGPRRSFDNSFDQSNGGGDDPFDPQDYLTFAESTTGNLKIL